MPEKPAETAIRLATYLSKARSRIEESGEVEKENPFALALYVVCITIQTAILNGKLLEFAAHCFEFTAKQAGREVPAELAGLHAPHEPSDN